MTSTPPRKPPMAGSPTPRTGEYGIAVLLVVACLAVLMPFTAMFNYRARVDWQSAVNLRDQVAARNLERGAVRLSLLLFELQRMVFNQQQFRSMVGSMDITQVAPYLMSVFGTQDGAEGLGALVGLDTTMLSDLALEGGGFEVRVEAESGKLNVNCLADQGGGKGKGSTRRAVETLEALMLPALYNNLFEEEKSDGQRYARQDVIQAMADYVDDDRRAFDIVDMKSGSTPERYRYEELFDPYQARNARLDSVDELHLVRGIDDDWMAAFGSELTVYGSCKVNLNFASAEQIALVLRHSVAPDDAWRTEGDQFLLKTLPLANYLLETRTFHLFGSLQEFQKFVERPDQFANPLTAFTDSAEDTSVVMPAIPEGMAIKLEAGKNEDDGTEWGGLKEIATVAPERVYRVEVITSVGAVSKRLIAVYDMQATRAQSQGKGAWLYFREE